MLTKTKLALAAASIVSMLGLASGAMAAPGTHRGPVGSEVRAELINRPAPDRYVQQYTVEDFYSARDSW